jgi:hypothetical protein
MDEFQVNTLLRGSLPTKPAPQTAKPKTCAWHTPWNISMEQFAEGTWPSVILQNEFYPFTGLLSSQHFSQFILRRQPAIMHRAIMALSPVKARSPTAFSASGDTVRGQEPTLGQTDTVTRAPKLLYIFGGPRPLASVDNRARTHLSLNKDAPVPLANSLNSAHSRYPNSRRFTSSLCSGLINERDRS